MEDKCNACATEVATRLGFSLKDKQLEAMLSFMSSKDVFVSLPMGYWKSLIYAVLPLVFIYIKVSCKDWCSHYYV